MLIFLGCIACILGFTIFFMLWRLFLSEEIKVFAVDNLFERAYITVVILTVVYTVVWITSLPLHHLGSYLFHFNPYYTAPWSYVSYWSFQLGSGLGTTTVLLLHPSRYEKFQRKEQERKRKEEELEQERKRKEAETAAQEKEKRELEQQDWWQSVEWSLSSIDGLMIHFWDPLRPHDVNGNDKHSDPAYHSNAATGINIGTGMNNHIIIVGHPGSGKSYLLSTIIMRLTHCYNPDELTLSLLDFKMGVGFSAFRKLPHAKVVALDSDRELGLAALLQVSSEVSRRGNLFREVGAETISEYRNRTNLLLPRWVVVMDEWTELVSGDNRISSQCISVIDHILRQGRAFGIHLILASQNFPASVLPSTSMEMISTRILLSCSNDDYMRLTGFSIGAGWSYGKQDQGDFALYTTIENRFYACKAADVGEKLTVEVRNDHVLRMSQMDSRRPLVFNGGQSAEFPDHLLNDNHLKLWLGTPLSVERDFGIKILKQSGQNLVVVSRDNQLINAVVENVQKIKSQVRADLEIVLVSDSPLEYSGPYRHVRCNEAYEEFSRLAALVESETVSLTDSFLIIPNIEDLRALRDDYGKMREVILRLLESGPSKGLHLIIGSVTARSLVNHIGSKGLSECSHRISGPMDEAESTRLFDSIVASRLVKENRYVAYSDSRPGEFHKFIPYRRA